MKKCVLISVLSLILSIPFAGDAFAQMKAYGAPINLETAKKAAASAIAEALKTIGAWLSPSPTSPATLSTLRR